ncbi:hypothetical protein B0O99DRAFT_680394 [Bisporella sp. PMI_857]|nr:hypothetical protein B0O99DRAFT_680394 [Bisporella sp. PMI_857]
MSGQGYYDNNQAGNHVPQHGSSSPFEQSGGPQPQQPTANNPSSLSSSNVPPFNSESYQPPTGAPPRRADTFQESDFVPVSERGEQREAMEQFEMNKDPRAEDGADRDVATLQREFPGVDGSLIAALYNDTKSLGSTREVLQELASS